jgi:hypothetical protein
MKTQIRTLLLLVGIAFEVLLATGCAHTLNGASKDYHNAEDHVENAVK